MVDDIGRAGKLSGSDEPRSAAPEGVAFVVAERMADPLSDEAVVAAVLADDDAPTLAAPVAPLDAAAAVLLVTEGGCGPPACARVLLLKLSLVTVIESVVDCFSFSGSADELLRLLDGRSLVLACDRVRDITVDPGIAGAAAAAACDRCEELSPLVLLAAVVRGEDTLFVRFAVADAVVEFVVGRVPGR